MTPAMCCTGKGGRGRKGKLEERKILREFAFHLLSQAGVSGDVCAGGDKIGFDSKDFFPRNISKRMEISRQPLVFLFAGSWSDGIGCSFLGNPIPAQLGVKENLITGSDLFAPGYPGNVWLENTMGGNRGMEQQSWHREVPMGHTPHSILAASKHVEARWDPKILTHTEPWSWDEDVGILHG